MKNHKTILLGSIAWIVTFVFSCSTNNVETSVSIHDTPGEYTFDASYDRSQTAFVYRYLDSCFAPEKSLSEHSTTERHVHLKDNTIFDIKTAEGSLHIEIDKTKNSRFSIARLKKICSGIKLNTSK
ncbi:hypothetical protein [Pedobacter duraquae]|uniref:Lipoprotein n=1 Tax=Pedobacter duraquae TaxID=425511 RepID=A0A4V3C3Y8_9SPHI|nr:hypothetical protein [Pedobacter duraquae]TDO23918.1 hypothetical protein CLV32_0204 [Pedobacter duraquae]